MTSRILDVWKDMRATTVGVDQACVRLFADNKSKTRKLNALLTSGKEAGIEIESNRPFREAEYENLLIQCISPKIGEYLIRVVLTDSAYEQVFANFCDEIKSRFVEYESQNGAHLLKKQLKQWRELLRADHKQMNPKKERGLWAELVVLQHACQKYGPAEALNSWVGPEGKPQDFVFNDVTYEIKALFQDLNKITISSFEQLDCEGELRLALIPMEKSDKGISVFEMINNLGEEFFNDHGLSELFFEKLEAVDYVHIDKVAPTKYVQIDDIRLYDANKPDFPALRRSEVPVEIHDGTYTLSLMKLANFRLTGDML